MPRRGAKRARLCRRQSWPDLLQHDLLGEVIRRLPAIGDRLRFRAEPAPVPWLAAAGHCIGVHDAAIHHVALPEDARGATCLGTFGNCWPWCPCRRRPRASPSC